MIIKKKRIRKLTAFKEILKQHPEIILGIQIREGSEQKLKNMGFTEKLANGETLLPSSSLGPVSRANALGLDIIQKNEPKETAYRTVNWKWIEWHGRYDRVEKEKFIDVPYSRYPRIHVPAKSMELSVFRKPTGECYVVSIPIKVNNSELLLHTINLFLEIFGECEFLTADLENIVKNPTIKLNWQILPPGIRPWQELKKELDPIIKSAPEGKQDFIVHRLKLIHSLQPDFTAFGTAGFYGYIILGFKQNGVYILESLFYGNATYILGKNWAELSKMTKAEILNASLQEDRLIHNRIWEEKFKLWKVKAFFKGARLDQKN